MDKITIGNVVVLNSGGPLMTVERCVAAGKVEVFWTDGDGHVKRDDFPRVCLRRPTVSEQTSRNPFAAPVDYAKHSKP